VRRPEDDPEELEDPDDPDELEDPDDPEPEDPDDPELDEPEEPELDEPDEPEPEDEPEELDDEVTENVNSGGMIDVEGPQARKTAGIKNRYLFMVGFGFLERGCCYLAWSTTKST